LETRWNMIPALIGTLTMLQTLLLTAFMLTYTVFQVPGGLFGQKAGVGGFNDGPARFRTTAGGVKLAGSEWACVNGLYCWSSSKKFRSMS